MKLVTFWSVVPSGAQLVKMVPGPWAATAATTVANRVRSFIVSELEGGRVETSVVGTNEEGNGLAYIHLRYSFLRRIALDRCSRPDRLPDREENTDKWQLH